MTRWDGSGAQHLTLAAAGPPAARRGDRAAARAGERRPSSSTARGGRYRELSQLARRAGTSAAAAADRLRAAGSHGVADRDSRAPARRRPLARHRRSGGGAPHPPRAAARRAGRARLMWLNTFKLKLSLTVAGFDARAHAYDWRLGIEDARRPVEHADRRDARRDVMLVGHSMGGLVARAALGRQRTAGSAASCRSARRTAARTRRCSLCAACILRCASSPLSISGTAPRTWRGSSSARCRRCTNCCRPARRAGRTCSMPRNGRPMRCDRTRSCSSGAPSRQRATQPRRRALPAHRHPPGDVVTGLKRTERVRVPADRRG